MENMSLRKKEIIAIIISAMFFIIAIACICIVTESNASDPIKEALFATAIAIFAILIVCFYGAANSEYIYYSLPKKAIQAVKGSGKIIKIVDVKEDCKVVGLVPEYDMRIAEKYFEKTLIMSNGDKYRMKEIRYYETNQDTDVTVEKLKD